MAKLTLQDFSSGYALVSVLNTNNALIEAAIENTLSRNGAVPNQMAVDIDMNSNRINNLADSQIGTDAVNQNQVSVLIAAAGASLPTGPLAASLVTIIDAGGNYASADAEGALGEIWTLLASTSNGEGAAFLGIEDALGDFAATDVEAALAELFAAQPVTATTAVSGIVELATDAEITAGTADKIPDAAGILANVNTGFESGSFTPGLTGFSAPPGSPSISFIRQGNIVTLQLNIGTGTSNATTFNITGVPASLQTDDARTVVLMGVIDNGQPTVVGSLQMGAGSSTWQVAIDNDPSGWTNSGTKGLDINITIPVCTYPLTMSV